MAYFARLGVDNIVVRVDSVDNRNAMTYNGIEKEEIALEYLRKIHGNAGTWVKCSYNTVDGVHQFGGTPLRANFPGGNNEDDPWYYHSEYDIFYKKQPIGCDSWTLNSITGRWEPPLSCPEVTREQVEIGSFYRWNEDAYQADNTTGWELLNHLAE